MLKLKKKHCRQPKLLMLYTLSKCTVIFYSALTAAWIILKSFIFLTLMVGCSTKYFLWNLMNLFHGIKEENTPSQWIWNIFLWNIYIFQWLGTANAFNESSVYYAKLRGHHMYPCNCYNHLQCFIFILLFQLFAYLFLSRTSKWAKGKLTFYHWAS